MVVSESQDILKPPTVTEKQDKEAFSINIEQGW